MVKDFIGKFFLNIKLLIIGRASKKIHAFAVVGVTIFFYGACLLAQKLCECNFSIYTHTVSAQGHISSPGAWVFNTTVFISGILLIPHMLYLFRRMNPRFYLLNALCIVSGIIGCVGLMILAVIPSGVPNHGFPSHMAFEGFGFSLFLSYFIIISTFSKRDPKSNTKSRWMLFFILYFLLTLLLLFDIFIVKMDSFIEFFDLDPRVVEFPFREWMLLVCCTMYLIFFFLVLQDKNTEDQTPTNIRKNLMIRLKAHPYLYIIYAIELIFLGFSAFAIIYPTDIFRIYNINLEEFDILFLDLNMWQTLLMLFLIIFLLKYCVGKLSRYLRVSKEGAQKFLG